MTKGHILAFGWVKDVRQYPWEVTFWPEFLELRSTEIEVMVLHEVNICQDDVLEGSVRAELTPVHAMSVPMLFSNGTMWLPERYISSID